MRQGVSRPVRSLLRISRGDMIRSAETEVVKLDLADGLGGGAEEIEIFRPCATGVRRTGGHRGLEGKRRLQPGVCYL